MDNRNVNNEIDEAAVDPVDRLLETNKRTASGKGVALLALLLAVAAVGGSGWQYWQARSEQLGQVKQQESLARLETSQQQLARSIASFETQLDAFKSPLDVAELSRLRGRLKTVENQLGELDSQAGESQASTRALQGSVRSLEQRLTNTESGLVNVAASSQNSSVELDIAEIDFLLRTASERLQLFSDPVAAELALMAADVQIDALDDPLYLSVRQQIASARQALASLPGLDRVQLSSQLTEMQANIPGLPFRGEAVIEPEPVLADDAGWWESLKHTLSSLVTVRRRVPDDQAPLSLEDKDYLRQGLWLQLESARLALMRNDVSGYAASLDRVSHTVERFFENSSSAVQALTLQVAGLQQVKIAPVMPDISAPWTQLRQLRDSRRLLQSTLPVERADPVE